MLVKSRLLLLVKQNVGENSYQKICEFVALHIKSPYGLREPRGFVQGCGDLSVVPQLCVSWVNSVRDEQRSPNQLCIQQLVCLFNDCEEGPQLLGSPIHYPLDF